MGRILYEDSRSSLLQQSKKGKREKIDGKTRYEKRLNVKMANSVRSYNNLDMDKLFKQDIMDVHIPITGETAGYFVRISFGDFLDRLKRRIKQRKVTRVELKDVIYSLVSAFNGDNVYIFCECPDYKYRLAYWATQNNITSGRKENIPSKITNPNNDLGPGCKHIMLVLSNTKWLIKVASVVYNYINYMEVHYERLFADFIYPAIYDKPYDKDVQLDMFDDEIDTARPDIEKSQEYAKKKTQFKKGHQGGIQFAPKEDDSQLSIDTE